MGLLQPDEQPQFEVGGVSRRELLQALRLGLPSTEGIRIPLNAQGRGAQRLVLVAVLLRLARALEGVTPVGGFEEPEEALSPCAKASCRECLAASSPRVARYSS